MKYKDIKIGDLHIGTAVTKDLKHTETPSKIKQIICGHGKICFIREDEC